MPDAYLHFTLGIIVGAAFCAVIMGKFIHKIYQSSFVKLQTVMQKQDQTIKRQQETIKKLNNLLDEEMN